MYQFVGFFLTLEQMFDIHINMPHVITAPLSSETDRGPLLPPISFSLSRTKGGVFILSDFQSELITSV